MIFADEGIVAGERVHYEVTAHEDDGQRPVVPRVTRAGRQDLLTVPTPDDVAAAGLCCCAEVHDRPRNRDSHSRPSSAIGAAAVAASASSRSAAMFHSFCGRTPSPSRRRNLASTSAFRRASSVLTKIPMPDCARCYSRQPPEPLATLGAERRTDTPQCFLMLPRP